MGWGFGITCSETILVCPNSLETMITSDGGYTINLCIDIIMVGQIQACQKTADVPDSALSL